MNADIEKIRQDLISSFKEIKEENWENNFAPGTFGGHELLDRLSVVLETFDSIICSHPACVFNQEWFEEAMDIARRIGELYQKVGQHQFDALKVK